jgi:hypothetical protein
MADRLNVPKSFAAFALLRKRRGPMGHFPQSASARTMSRATKANSAAIATIGSQSTLSIRRARRTLDPQLLGEPFIVAGPDFGYGVLPGRSKHCL